MEPFTLLSFLTEEDIQGLAEETRNKLESFLKAKHSEVIEQKSEFEKLRVLSGEPASQLLIFF